MSMASGLYRAMAAGVLSLHAAHIVWVIFGAFLTRGRRWLARLDAATLVSFEDVFARQVQALMSKDDLLMCISASGNSPNVSRAVEEAKKIGARTAALLGKAEAAPQRSWIGALVVPSNMTLDVQEAQITIRYIVCGLVEKWL